MIQSARDTLFKIDSVEEDFIFNEHVVEVFDDMLDRSIPFYDEVIDAAANLLDRFLTPEDTVYDLGCATGTTLLKFSRHLEKRALKFVGVDNSALMLDKARLKAELYSKTESISFIEEDITRINQKDVGAFIVNYTLQFIRPLKREKFIRRLYNNLRPGGVLLLSEKIISHDHRLNREYIDIYHRFKKAKGYSELEIAKKREALENILIPFSIDENKELLQSCSFQPVATFFQWFNFVSFIAVKPS
jgi:tRNA (cmo5U34)-methyltransferase